MMTEAELWHMHLLAVDNTTNGVEGVVSLIFGYLAAAYFVGGKLNRFQASVATVFFVVTACVFSFYTLVEYRRAAYFIAELTENYGIKSIAPNDFIVPVFAVVLALLIPACVYFMYEVRKKAKTGETAG